MPDESRPPDDPGEPQMLAAVDLGSNNFRMVIARRVGNELRIVDRLREGVRLAGYLDPKQRLSGEGKKRALSCLGKFDQRVRDFPQGAVRAVGTNTLRKARNIRKFLRRAGKAIGHPIEVVAGQEEARLIYLGACHSLSEGAGRLLVVDIGGGSTECIVGESFEPRCAESLYMGCVSYTLSFSPGSKISRKRFRRAALVARLEMRPMMADFRKVGWRHAAGGSGTINAVSESERNPACERLERSRHHPGGLGRLRQSILSFEHVDQLKLDGLGRDRAKVLPGGVAILSAVFKNLAIERMTVSSGAMREGVLDDLLGRIRHEDVRDRTIQGFIEQYHVDVAQVARVSRTALLCLDQVADDWKLDRESSAHFLSWGASLHKIGLGIAHAGFHKHGAYLIDHSDMPGFSFQDQETLSLLVRAVRRKFPKPLFKELPARRARAAKRLSALLRLAVLLNRSRSPRALPEIVLRARKKTLFLTLPAGWLEEQPLTGVDLEREAAYLQAARIELQIH